MARRLLIAAAVCAAAGAFGPSALAAANHSVTTAHFVVWYDSDTTKADYATATEASDLAAMAEHALAVEESWGYDAPVGDANGRSSITIADLSADKADLEYGAVGSAPVSAPAEVSADIEVADIGTAQEQHLAASAVFTMIMGRYWIPTGWNSGDTSENWLVYGPSEWAGYKVDDYASVSDVGPPPVSVDCEDYSTTLNMCDKDNYINRGSSRWVFYEDLAERYGPSFMKTVWQDAAATNALTGLENAITSKGNTLTDVFNDYSVKVMTGGWGLPTLDAVAPTIYGSPVVTGAQTGAFATTVVPVDHLASRIVELTRGDGAGDHPCFAATLSLSVSMPSGVSARPYFFWTGSTSPVPLTISGTTATATVPWDTCKWSKNVAYLVLPNDTTNVDAVPFTVSGSIAVDQTTPATPDTGPTLPSLTTPTVAVPTGEVVPTVDLLEPLLLHVTPASTQLRLIVSSDAAGEVHATLGSTDLGTFSVRAGNNDLRCKLPQTLLAALRRSSAAGNTLTVTPLSPSGSLSGAVVTRTVVVDGPVRKQKRTRAAAKKRAKK